MGGNRNTREVTPPFPSPNCIITKAANQTITSGVISKVLFDTKISEYRLTFDVANNQINVNEDGLYIIDFYGGFQSNAVGYRLWDILINGLAVKRYIYPAPTLATAAAMGVNLSPIQLFNGDIIAAQVQQTSGGNLTFNATASAPRLAVIKSSDITP